jgi:hypothetical protein
VTNFSLFRRAAFPALLSAFLCVTDAQAELGGTMSFTAAAPVSLLNGAARMRTSVDAGGTTIDEYASSTGRIFAYTWQGPTMPDLRALLGPYDASYRSGATANLAAGRELHAARVARPDVVVESGGQMRSYVGRAWLPDALPAGVTPDDLH